MTKCSSISLSAEHRAALEANRPRHDDDVLTWKPVQAFILLDKKRIPKLSAGCLTLTRLF